MNKDDKTQKNNVEFEKRIEELEQEKTELENNWKRALADYKNLEKRVAEEKGAIYAYSNLVLISQLLPILDNLSMLESHIDDMGLKLISKEFEQILKNEGLSELGEEGEDFDPQTMEAIEMVEGEANKVIEVAQKGYKLKDKLVRPARVKVGKEQ